MKTPPSGEHPRFTCRREGCKLPVRVTTGAHFVVSYVVRCQRCGRYVQVDAPTPGKTTCPG